MLVGMASKISKNYTYKCAQDTTESRVPRLNVHTNQILAHTFSHGTLDNIWKCFCILFIYFFWVIELATTVSSLVDKVQFDKSNYSTVGRSSCLVHVQWMKDRSRTVNSCLFK